VLPPGMPFMGAGGKAGQELGAGGSLLFTCVFTAVPRPSGLGGVSMGTDKVWGEAEALQRP